MSHQSAWYLGAPSVVRRWPELPDTIVIPAMSHQSAVVPESFGSGADPPDTIVIPAMSHAGVLQLIAFFCLSGRWARILLWSTKGSGDWTCAEPGVSALASNDFSED